MFPIKCINPKCRSPDGTFFLKEEDHLEPGGRFLKAYEQGADSLIACCPYCDAENKVWAIGLKEDIDEVVRGLCE